MTKAVAKRPAAKKAVAKRKPKLPALGVLTDVKMREFAKVVNIGKDFALIPHAGGKLVEPTRDLAMKIIAFFNLSFDTELVSVDEEVVKNSRNQKMTFKVFTMKATVTAPNGTKAAGHGRASTRNTHTEGREEHDAMATAETRAIKRAIEGRVGLPMINQLIVKFFGGFVIGPNKEKELGLR